MSRSSSAARFLLTVLRSGGVGVANTVAPSHDGTAPVVGTEIVGTAGTWTGSPTLTYQWYRNAVSSTSGGSAIGSATNLNYTSVDADFGYYLYFAEIPNGGTGAQVFSNVSGVRVAKVPATTLGAQLLVNNDFSDGTGTFPNGWSFTAGTSGGDPGVSEVASGGGAGTGAAKFTSTATATSPSITQSVLASGTFYEFEVVLSAFTAGLFQFRSSDGVITAGHANLGATGTFRDIGRSGVTSLEFRSAGAAPHNATFDSASIKAVTLNTELTALSANMRIDFFYTLPGTPRAGDSLWLMTRISSLASGNYWLARLSYTGSAWDMILYSVATHSRTVRIGIGGVGATDGMRVNMNGDNISLYKTANAGGSWTQVGTTISNATYNTATGVNALYLSSFTPGQFVYAPAD